MIRFTACSVAVHSRKEGNAEGGQQTKHIKLRNCVTKTRLTGLVMEFLLIQVAMRIVAGSCHLVVIEVGSNKIRPTDLHVFCRAIDHLDRLSIRETIVVTVDLISFSGGNCTTPSVRTLLSSILLSPAVSAMTHTVAGKERKKEKGKATKKSIVKDSGDGAKIMRAVRVGQRAYANDSELIHLHQPSIPCTTHGFMKNLKIRIKHGAGETACL